MHHHEPEFRYCPVCGGRLGSSQLKPNEPPRLVCPKCEFVFYLDPKLVGCSVVRFDDKIVLLKRAIDPQRGKWVLPGGYVDRGEEVPGAAVRETEEECGIRTRIEDLLGIYSYAGRTQVVVVYLVTHVSGKLISGDETLEARLFSEEEIPWQDLAFPSTVDALKDYFNLRKQEKTPDEDKTGKAR